MDGIPLDPEILAIIENNDAREQIQHDLMAEIAAMSVDFSKELEDWIDLLLETIFGNIYFEEITDDYQGDEFKNLYKVTDYDGKKLTLNHLKKIYLTRSDEQITLESHQGNIFVLLPNSKYLKLWWVD